MDNSDNLTKKRETRILKKKGATAGGAKILKIEKRQAKVKKAVKKVGAGIKKTAGAVVLAPLLPFKPAMERELKARGHWAKGMTLKEVAYGFYTEVVSKKGDKYSNYEVIPFHDFVDNIAFHSTVEEAASDNQIGAAAATIGTIVEAIINIFKNAKEKRQAAKKAGMSEKEYKAQTTDTEARVGEAGEQVEKELEEKAIDEEQVKKLDMKKYITYGVIILAVVLVIYFITKKKK